MRFVPIAQRPDPARTDMAAEIPSISAHEFFYGVPDGVWNLFSSRTDLDDYESLHHVVLKSKQCEVN